MTMRSRRRQAHIARQRSMHRADAYFLRYDYTYLMRHSTPYFSHNDPCFEVIPMSVEFPGFVTMVHPKSDVYEQLSVRMSVDLNAKLFTGELGLIEPLGVTICRS